MDSHLPVDEQSTGHEDLQDTRSIKSHRTPKPIVHADFVYNLPAPRAKRPNFELNGTDTAKRRKSAKLLNDDEVNVNGENIELDDKNSDPSCLVNESDSQVHSDSQPSQSTTEFVNDQPKKKKKSLANKLNGKLPSTENGVDATSNGVESPKKSKAPKSELSFICDETITEADSPENTFTGFTDDDSFIPTENGKTPKNRRPTLMTYILRALAEHPDGASGLADIYEYIRNTSDRYRTLQTEWRSSVRNCLSSSRRFVKQPRPATDKQRGALWALNPDHPSNSELIAYPKDASKFVSLEPRLPNTPKAKKKIVKLNLDDDTTLLDSLDIDGSSTMSTEDLSRRSYTPLSTRNVEQAPQIRLSIVTTDDHLNIQQSPHLQYTPASYPTTPYSSLTPVTNAPCQYVYYLPTTSSANNGRPLQILLQPATEYKTFDSGNGVVTSSEVVGYETSTTCLDAQQPLYTSNPYPSPIDSWSDCLQEDEENWLPQPLAPKLQNVAESELNALNNSNSVYFQL